MLGLCYAGSPLLQAESEAAQAHDSANYQASARPGCLAPHAWLPDSRSLYDLFGPGFTLVVADHAVEGEIGRVVADALDLGVALEVVRPLEVPVRDLYHADLTLIRPNQHVAWRGDRWTSPLARATGRSGKD